MPDELTLKRVIDLEEKSEITNADYALVDSVSGGAKKFALGVKLNGLPTMIDDKIDAKLNDLPTMIDDQIDTKFGDSIGDEVTSWLDENVDPVGSAVVVDNTLSISGAAADAKKTGDEISSVKDGLSAIEGKFPITSTDIDPTDYTAVQTLISSSTGKWSGTATNRSWFIPVDNADEVTITANQTTYTIYAFLKTDAHVANTTPDYATGSERSIIASGESMTISVPYDAVYLYVVKQTSAGTFTPASIVYRTYGDVPSVDATLTTQGAAADSKATGDAIKTVADAVTIKEDIDIGSATVISGLINTSNIWSTSAGFKSYAFDVVEGCYKLSVTADENNNSAVGFLKTSDLIRQQTPPFCDGITSRLIVQAGTTTDFDIPSDCHFIVIMKEGSGGTDYTPDSIIFYKWGVKSTEHIPLGLHEMPRSESVINIVKRCRQMTDIKWTPAVDLHRYMRVQTDGAIPETAVTQNYLGTFKAGTEYTGVPYGRVNGTTDAYGIEYGTVGHYIDFETFVSSVSNENSRLCTEDVGSVSAHRSVVYATVCSGLTCYALNVAEVPTASIPSISGLTLVGKINDNGVFLGDSNFQIGDVLNKYDYHTAIITDIIRDNEGTIQSVELSDASTGGLADRNYADGQNGGICRRKGWTREQLFDANSWGAYSLYRYTGNVPYTPSQYVNVGDEFNMQRIEHFPCMPYEGNKFTYKTGYIPNNAIKILISLNGYAYLKVFKDGVEITGSPFAVTSETESIDVSEISSGEYSAYLCNISNGDVTNLTYPCKWTILS